MSFSLIFEKLDFLTRRPYFGYLIFIDISKSAHQGVKNLAFLTRNIFYIDHRVRRPIKTCQKLTFSLRSRDRDRDRDRDRH